MYNPEARRPPAIPWLFQPLSFLALLVATVIAAATASLEVTLLLGTLVLLGFGAVVWSRFSLRRIAYQRRISPPRAFAGETITLETTLSNRKPLPMPWVEVWERLPRMLDPGGELERSVSEPGQVWMSQGASLWPYRRARWRHTLECRRRGVYTLRDVWVRSGDPFGLFERETWLAGRTEVVVYPKVVPLQRLGLLLRHPALDLAAHRSLVTDPARTRGLRRYEAGDSPRLIHWRATAHLGELQVRLLEHATSLQVNLLVDASSFSDTWGDSRRALFELTLSAVASIAVYLQRLGHPVALVTDGSSGYRLEPSASPAQVQAILEVLARLEPESTGHSFEWTSARLPRGSAAILAVSDFAVGLEETVTRLEEAGHQTVVLLAGASRSGELPLDRTVRLAPGCDLAATLEGGG